MANTTCQKCQQNFYSILSPLSLNMLFLAGVFFSSLSCSELISYYIVIVSPQWCCWCHQQKQNTSCKWIFIFGIFAWTDEVDWAEETQFFVFPDEADHKIWISSLRNPITSMSLSSNWWPSCQWLCIIYSYIGHGVLRSIFEQFFLIFLLQILSVLRCMENLQADPETFQNFVRHWTRYNRYISHIIWEEISSKWIW